MGEKRRGGLGCKEVIGRWDWSLWNSKGAKVR
jgi:hypothetical protein